MNFRADGAGCSSEMEALIEALNEASLDPYTRTRLIMDPVGTLEAMRVPIPAGVRVDVSTDGAGNVRLTVARPQPESSELSEEALDRVVGGAAEPCGGQEFAFSIVLGAAA